MRVLVTGADGFVGPYAISALRRLGGPSLEIVGTARRVPNGSTPINSLALDLTDSQAIDCVINEVRPSHVLHLAGISAPAVAESDPELAWAVNVQGTLKLARRIKVLLPDCWFVNIGSGLSYGASAKSGNALTESALLAPIDEYGASKAAADLALGAMAAKGLKCIRVRPFNHAGPGQSDEFVIGHFAMSVGKIEAGLMPPVMHVGNLNSQRDFLDVRDVANAYAMIIKTADTLTAGTIFNIASGVPRRIADILASLLDKSAVKIDIRQNNDNRGVIDLPVIFGDPSYAQRTLGWKQHHSFDQTLTDMLEDARIRVAHG